jgi:membrane protease YdiL (CAAX protease family)
LPVSTSGPGSQIFTGLVLVVAVAFVEEVIYRGVLQTTATAVMGRIGVLLMSLAFAAGYLGNGSLASVTIAFGFGLVFALLVARTGSLLGVTLAHGLALVLAKLLLPMLIGPAA